MAKFSMVSIKENTTYPYKKPRSLKHPTTGSDEIFHPANSPSRTGNNNGSSFYNCENVRYLEEIGVTDYADFPAMKYFMSRYGVWPSTLQYNCILNYADFVRKTTKFKKGFYCESSKEIRWREGMVVSGEIKVKLDFVCFEDKKNKIVLYITIYPDYDSTRNTATFVVVGVFAPNRNADEVLSLIKDKIIGLSLLPPDGIELGSLYILTSSKDGFELEPKKIDTPKIDFGLNYNADFEPIHSLIIEKLSIGKSKGLILLHGRHGTGKTTYIRYLINVLKKRVIYIPPNMTNAISDPHLIKFLLDYPNSVLIVEDAESVLMKRVANSSQAIANILNLTDGLLSDCLNMQIVATFNTDVSNIDEALLRKGRLIAKYEFKELEASRLKLLSEKLGVNISGKHTLADIYNAEEQSFTKKNNQIGFKAATA